MIRNARALNISISGPILHAKAESFGKGLGLETFLSGWLSRFKQRHDKHFRVISGESGAMKSKQTDYLTTTTLQKFLIDFVPNDIFNADESGLFFKLPPEKIIGIKADSCHGGKRSKARITILSCANMTEMDKNASAGCR